MDGFQYFASYFQEIANKLRSLNVDLLMQGAELIQETAHSGGKVIVIGNGGSAAMASHVALDLTRTAGIRSISFSDPSFITCLSNDYGYEDWVVKAFECYADRGDLALLISSGGRSANILNGARQARATGMSILTLSGFSPDNPLRQIGDVNLYVESRAYNVVEMVHQTWLLAIVDYLTAARETRE